MTKGEGGYSLIEGIISVALLGLIVTGFLLALSTASKSRSVLDERDTAMTLAESQMEYVKKLGYLVSYSPAPISGDYSGYSVTINTDNINSRDGNIQKISIIVDHQGKPIIMHGNATLEGFKVKQ